MNNTDETPLRTGKVFAIKAFTMRGVSYQPGDPVDTTELPDHKVGQLLNQRYMRPGTVGELQ